MNTKNFALALAALISLITLAGTHVQASQIFVVQCTPVHFLNVSQREGVFVDFIPRQSSVTLPSQSDVQFFPSNSYSMHTHGMVADFNGVGFDAVKVSEVDRTNLGTVYSVKLKINSQAVATKYNFGSLTVYTTCTEVRSSSSFGDDSAE